jgi:membrane protease YdiL (CAAX protease family)
MKRLALLGLGTSLAGFLFFLAFRGPRNHFWDRMTGTGVALGSLALVAQPKLRKTRLGLREILFGAISAAVLYGIFQIGDRITRRIVPGGSRQIDEIYALKKLRSRKELMLRMSLVVGPTEEFFWRGFLQDGLMQRFGQLKGTLLGIAAYGGAHIVSGSFTLVGAATVAGGFWSVLYALGFPLGALIVNHILWDNVILLIAPTTQLTGDEETNVQPEIS